MLSRSEIAVLKQKRRRREYAICKNFLKNRV